jgi:hypothetical protein
VSEHRPEDVMTTCGTTNERVYASPVQDIRTFLALGGVGDEARMVAQIILYNNPHSSTSHVVDEPEILRRWASQLLQASFRLDEARRHGT